MRLHKRMRAVALGVAAGLLLLAPGASANRGSVLNTGVPFATMWTPMELEAAGITVRCNVTLWGKMGGLTFSKTAGLQVGRIIEAEVESCSGGSARVLTETLPWALSYASFAGTLPSITGITLSVVGAAIRITPREGLECLARTSSSEPAKVTGTLAREAGGQLEIASTRLDERSGIALTGGFLCSLAGRGDLAGTGRSAGEAPPLTVRLI